MMPRRIDLHGLTVDEAMAVFVRRYNALVDDGYRGGIEVIHGYGSSGQGGAIRRKLRAFLDAHRDRFKHISHGEARGNPGVTIVEPKGRLPLPQKTDSALARAILEFCGTPRTEAKILAKLVGRYGDPAIRMEIRQMVGEGSLEMVREGREVKYVAK